MLMAVMTEVPGRRIGFVRAIGTGRRPEGLQRHDQHDEDQDQAFHESENQIKNDGQGISKIRRDDSGRVAGLQLLFMHGLCCK